MNKSTIFFTFSFLLFTFAFSFAQESKIVKTDTLKTINQPNSPQAEEGDVKITDGTNTLIRITDEGTFGTIEIKNGVPSATTDKLYNDAGTLKFDGSSLGGGSGATEINDLTDGKTGGSSVFLGTNSGTNDDGTDNRNTGLGQGALAAVSNGQYNVGIGYASLKNISTGIGNVSIGLNSLFSSISGNYNIALGQGSQYYLTDGKNNIAIGFQANINNSSGQDNTIIGHLAGGGGSSHSKSGNVFLGFSAGFNETSDNKLYIENSSSASPLIWGDFTADSVKINGGLEVTSKIKTPLIQVTTGAANGDVLMSDANGNATWNPTANIDKDWFVSGNNMSSQPTGNVGIGVSTPSTKLEINGKTKTTQLQVTSGATNGYVLTSDASGNASWQTSAVSGATEINELTDAKFDGTSLFLGENAGTNDDATSNNNTSVGVNSLQANTTGNQNTAIAFNSLQSNTLGSFNVAIGRSSLGSNTTGIHNVGIGNVTNFYNEEGSNNTLIGYEAGLGTTLHNKSGVIFIGHQAGYYETDSDKLYIENSNSSSPLIWGDFALDKVKINGELEITSKTKTPLLQLTTGATDGYILTSDETGNASWQEGSISASDDDWTINGTEVYHIGKVGIGVTTPNSKLSVGGSGSSNASISGESHISSGYGVYGSTNASGYGVGVYGTSSGSGSNSSSIAVYGKHINGGIGVKGQSTGATGIAILGTRPSTTGLAGRFEGPVEITGKLSVGASPTTMAYQLAVDGSAAKSSGGSSWAVASDIRLKNLLGNYNKGLSEIEKLNTVKFKYKENNPLNLPNKEIEYGFVAQEVQEIFPEAVNKSTKGYLDFNMHIINVAMVNAVQELSKKNNELKQKLEKYEEVHKNLKTVIHENKELRNEMEIIKTALNNLIKTKPQIKVSKK